MSTTDTAIPKGKLTLGSFVLYAVLALVCYGSTLHGGFLVDDWWWAQVAQSGHWPPFNANTVFFRPLSSLVFVAYWKLFGADPFGYRSASLVFYILAAVVVRAIWDAITEGQNRWAGVLAGALFILWPSHAEAVSWISGFSDQLVVLFGATALWLYIRFLLKPNWTTGIGASLALLAALLSKESAFVLPLVIFAVGQFLVPAEAHLKRRVISHGFVAAALTVAYLLVRTAIIGKIVGGYGHYGYAEIIAGLVGWKLVVNMSNLYLPVAKFIAFNLSPNYVRITLLAVLVGLATGMYRLVPKGKDITIGQKRWVGLLLLVGLCWSIYLETGGFLYEVLSVVLDKSHAFRFVAPLLLVLLAYLIIKVGRRNWDSIDGFLAGWRFRYAWVAAAILVFIIDWCWLIVSGLDLVVELLAFAAFIQICYLTRPMRKPASSLTRAPKDQRVDYIRIAGVMLVASVAALLPSINLPINLDGQQGRFSYLGTLFSVLALLAAVQPILRNVEWRRATSLVGCLALFLATLSNAAEWTQTGNISRETTSAITSLLPARRIYVIAAPGTIDSALLFLGGIENIGQVAGNDPKVQILLDYKLLNFREGDEITCSLLAPNQAALFVRPYRGRRLEPLASVLAPESGYFHTRDEGQATLTQLLGFKPGDHAIYVAGDGPHVLE